MVLLLIDGIIDELKKGIAESLYNFIATNLQDANGYVSTRLSTLVQDLSADPQSFAANVFNLVKNIQETAIIPIAGIILTYVFCYELIQLAISRNNTQDIGSWELARVIFKIAIGIYFIRNSFTIVMALFDVGTYIIQKAGGLVSQTNSTIPVEKGLSVAKQYQAQLNIGGLLSLLLVGALMTFGAFASGIAAQYIVLARIIEIYIASSVAPLTMGGIVSREFSDAGKGYLKYMFSLAL